MNHFRPPIKSGEEFLPKYSRSIRLTRAVGSPIIKACYTKRLTRNWPRSCANSYRLRCSHSSWALRSRLRFELGDDVAPGISRRCRFFALHAGTANNRWARRGRQLKSSLTKSQGRAIFIGDMPIALCAFGAVTLFKRSRHWFYFLAPEVGRSAGFSVGGELRRLPNTSAYWRVNCAPKKKICAE